MKTYQKIANIYKWDAKYKNIVGINQPFEALKDIKWLGTEKIDGTNVRIYWDGHDITWHGHTEKSTLPENLKAFLAEKFGAKEMEYVFEQMFGDKEVYIFGEGYGYKIQTNGDKYTQDKTCNFIIFDINVDGWDLKRENIIDIAKNLDCQVVPVVFEGTLIEAEQFVASHPMSTLNGGLHEMEGIVIQPCDVQLYDNKGNLIKGKVKYQDLVKANKI